MKSSAPERKRGPRIHDITQVRLPDFECYALRNGIPVYEINSGTQDVIRLELVFKAGRPYEHKKLVSRATASMLLEGSSEKSSAEIAEKVDFYGASLTCHASFDTINLTLTCLKKHFSHLLPLIGELWLEAVFPENELKTYISINKQRLKYELSKNDVVAYRTLTEKIFGEDHPYGYNSLPESYDQLTVQDLKRHTDERLGVNNVSLFLSGKVDDQIKRIIDHSLGNIVKTGIQSLNRIKNKKSRPEKIYLKHYSPHQTSIRIGRPLFSRIHPDFPGVFVLNTILGGYFGSRLMLNIREKLGYTYGIHSSVDNFVFDGYFSIQTEVGNDFVQETISQIHREMEVLMTELVPIRELKMVKNYIMGNLLGMLDGPFNVSKLLRTMIIADQKPEAFDKMIQQIQAIQPKDLQILAQKYLSPKDFWTVIVD